MTFYNTSSNTSQKSYNYTTKGIPKVDTQFLLNRAGAEGKVSSTVEEMQSESLLCDPTIFCSSFKRRRFYCFSSRSPDESTQSRDILNEKPNEDERLAQPEGSGRDLPTELVMRTTMGDIQVKLFASECPKTVENFVTHAKNGYFNGVIFHRVIKGFMIQTGDPLGNGTGGESIWGGEFKDEFHRTLRHDRPFTLSMANAGPNTNGSQFFITTVPTPWLDNKHTVFGRVVKGFETCSTIENLKVNKHDKPVEGDVRIIAIDVAGA